MEKLIQFLGDLFAAVIPCYHPDQDKYMWVGRVWELRALLMHQSNDKIQTISADSQQLSEFRKRELKAKLKDPELRPRLKRLAARSEWVEWVEWVEWGRVHGQVGQTH